METKNGNNLKLGAFVLSGIMVLMIALYFIGKKQNSWASGLEVRVHFSDLNGLVEGSNVYYAGTAAGSVQNIRILNDTTIEVKLIISDQVCRYIHRNAIAFIGSDGLIGNKVVNIKPRPGSFPLISEGDQLGSQETGGLDNVLPSVAKIGGNVAVISEVLKRNVVELDSSGLLRLLKNRRTAGLLQQSLQNLDRTAFNAAMLSGDIRSLAAGIKSGHGSAGKLLRDTQLYSNILGATSDIREAADSIRYLTGRINQQLLTDKGPVSVLLSDSTAANDLRATLQNIRQGTDNFNQNMEALKHNFLFRGFFRKKERDDQRQQQPAVPKKP